MHDEEVKDVFCSFSLEKFIVEERKLKFDKGYILLSLIKEGIWAKKIVVLVLVLVLQIKSHQS